MTDVNDQLVLVCGESGSGKSASLRNIRNQEKWYYVNTEAGKKLPMQNNFKFLKVIDPYQVYEAFDVGTTKADCEGIIIDSLTFLMDMFETKYISKSSDTRKAWDDYNQFFKTMLQEKVVAFNKPVIFLAHLQDTYDEKNLEYKQAVPIKGSLRGRGVEAYFSTVVYSMTLPLAKVEDFKDNGLLHVNEDEEIEGVKYIFQTRKTRDTTNTRIRSPIGLFSQKETYMDNDCQLLLDHLTKYYSKGKME